MTYLQPTIILQNSKSCFEDLAKELFPLYLYKQGNCHNLVQYASMWLSNKGIWHQKIWVYAPVRYDEDSKTVIKIPDPNQISPDGFLKWGYHVALLVIENGQSQVFDFFIDDTRPMSIEQWIAYMQLENYLLDVQSHRKYLFHTIATNKKNNGIFKGSYFEYEGRCKDENWLPKGLAINDTAVAFFQAEKAIIDSEKPLTVDFKLLVGSVNNFECVFRDKTFNKHMTESFQAKYKEIITEYRALYNQKLAKWVEAVSLL